MGNIFRSHFASAVLGGLVVAGGFLLLGITDQPATQTIIQEGPASSVTAPGANSRLSSNSIYERDAPGVVYVRAKLIQAIESPFDMFHQDDTSTSTGSGFLVDRRGDILTVYHVIDGADPIGGVTVGFEGGVTRVARVAGVDAAADLAVLKVDLNGVPALRPLPLGDSTTVRVGDPTLAIGNPYGVDRTLTSGTVAALQHQLEASNGVTVDNVIQTDQQLDPGGSGGPLLDADGHVIGINSQIANPAGNEPAISFATPINTATQVLAQVQRGGTGRLAYLGVNVVSSRQSRQGVTVTSAVKRGPAAVAGLRPGDAIVKLDGITLSTNAELQRLVSLRTPGQVVSLEIRRGGRIRIVQVQLGSRLAPPLNG